MTNPKGKPLSKKVRAAPIRYSQALAERICERLAGGESLNSICKSKGMPKESAVRFWVVDDYMGFAASYTRARQVGYERLAEEILQISNTPVHGIKKVSKPITFRNSDGDVVPTGEVLEEVTEGDMIEHRKLQVDTRKWILAKMLPKVYGDKQQVELTGKVDIAGGLLAARRRAGLRND